MVDEAVFFGLVLGGRLLLSLVERALRHWITDGTITCAAPRAKGVLHRKSGGAGATVEWNVVRLGFQEAGARPQPLGT